MEFFFIAVAPSIILTPENTSTVPPDPAMFSCTADSVPLSTISWWRIHNGTEIIILENSFTQISTTTLNDRLVSSILTFTTTHPLMLGVYVCSATNLLASVRASATLIVTGEL